MSHDHRTNESDDEFVDAVSELKVDDCNALKIEKNYDTSVKAKEDGNNHFRNKSYDDSIQSYSEAIAYCPVDDEHKEALSTYYGNRAAAYFSIDEYSQAVIDCNESLKLKPDYLKVLVRRAQCHEKLEQYEDAIKDFKAVQEIDPSYPKIQQTIAKLERLQSEKMEKLKTEALGKLKDLGNSLLGNFGMSLDNFKMTQDPNTGGWNISMQNNK